MSLAAFLVLKPDMLQIFKLISLDLYHLPENYYGLEDLI